MDEKQLIAIEKPRYLVQPQPDRIGYAIVDTKGQDQPYVINSLQSLSAYERRQRTPENNQHSAEYNKKVAESWAYTWNLVEMGYCGSCHTLLSTVKGHENEWYAAVGYNHLYRTICFACSCSQED
jgi:hypothetical protein